MGFLIHSYVSALELLTDEEGSFTVTRLTACGDVNGEPYTYSVFDGEIPAGVVPQSFIKEAETGFRRAYFRSLN